MLNIMQFLMLTGIVFFFFLFFAEVVVVRTVYEFPDTFFISFDAVY